MFMTSIPTAIGQLQAYADDHGLRRLLFPGSSPADISSQTTREEQSEHPILQEVRKQLSEYLSKKRHSFDLPLSLQGTSFQQAVWNLLCEIPYGDTSSYGTLAELLGNKHKARAVGGAAHANPLPIIIPCHRLIGAGGNLTGFAGGLSVKKYLLQLEGAVVQDKKR